MPVQFNHTIVPSKDQDAGAAFLADVLGLDPPPRVGPFSVVCLSNQVNLLYLNDPKASSQHYAFLVEDDEFELIVTRLRTRGTAYWADHARTVPGENTNFGGRGLYIDSPERHVIEIVTRACGGGGD